jgi:5-methylcytosine-specific restriction endonuclease McrA
VKAWKAGKYHGTRGAQLQLSQTIRNYILDKRGHKCNRCGWKQVNPTTGRVPVQVHHIDGNALNTKERNLEVLCPNCHALTPNWGAGNKGKGRTTTHRRMTSGKR